MKQKTGLIPGFIYTTEIVDKFGNPIDDPIITCNIIPIQGMQRIAALLLGTGTLVENWYIGLLKDNTTINEDTTLASIVASTSHEETSYTEATREAWAGVYDDSYLITNTASKAEFTFSAETSVHGAFLTNQSIKDSGTGIVLSVAEFSTVRNLSAGSVLRVTAALTLAST